MGVVQKFFIGFLLLIAVGTLIFLVKKHRDKTDPKHITSALKASEFSIVLSIPGYTPVFLDKNSDLFSSWGAIVLNKSDESSFSKAALEHQLTQLFSGQGWLPQKNLDIDIVDVDTNEFQTEDLQPFLNFDKTLLNNMNQYSTHYQLATKIDKTGKSLAFFYRLDTE